ncbi:MAG: alpha/beta fold hydrolase [Phycisphaerales bacterium]|nr:alpha/beta fold hydrolase [Phycisphaerales bacterium]
MVRNIGDILEERLRFESDGLSLEARLAYEQHIQPACAALIAGAHPLLGGHAENNVAQSLRSDLAAAGVATMTFNYRGVIRDDGSDLDWSRMVSEFWERGSVPEEALWWRDAKSALRELRRCVEVPIVLVGYSFGCWIVSRLIDCASPAAVICVSPNPGQHDMPALRRNRGPLLVVSSDDDFSCSLDELRRWFADLPAPKQHTLIPQAEHFFRGREREVSAAATTFLVDAGLLGDQP